jgi:hypothetical protein
VVKPGYGLLRLLHRLLGKQLLQACEVAMEYLLALTHSPQVPSDTCNFGLSRNAGFTCSRLPSPVAVTIIVQQCREAVTVVSAGCLGHGRTSGI